MIARRPPTLGEVRTPRRRFTALAAAPAAEPSRSGESSVPQVPAVTSVDLETPVPADHPAGRPAPVRLEDLGDVLTDRDLCALLQVSPRWAERRRSDAQAARVAADLPATIPGMRFPRYRRVDVEAWLRTGSSRQAERSIRRIS